MVPGSLPMFSTVIVALHSPARQPNCDTTNSKSPSRTGLPTSVCGSVAGGSVVGSAVVSGSDSALVGAAVTCGGLVDSGSPAIAPMMPRTMRMPTSETTTVRNALNLRPRGGGCGGCCPHCGCVGGPCGGGGGPQPPCPCGAPCCPCGGCGGPQPGCWPGGVPLMVEKHPGVGSR